MNSVSKAPGRAPRDPFLEQFFSRLPEEMHTDFTDRQLAALKSVFGDATRNGHGFDIHLGLSTPLIGRGIYMVFLGGRDRRDGQAARRSPARRGWRRLAVLGKLFIGVLFAMQLAFVAAALAIWFF